MKEVQIKDLQFNPYTKIGKEWLLVGANKPDGSFNAMTASWGGMGVLWGKNVITVYLRPQRYTKEFVDASDTFTISILPERYRQALAYYGSHSGRDGNKEEATGLHLDEEDGHTYIAEAKTVYVCKKLYVGEFKEENFLDKHVIEKDYPQRDYHSIYIGEILKVMEEE